MVPAGRAVRWGNYADNSHRWHKHSLWHMCFVQCQCKSWWRFVHWGSWATGSNRHGLAYPNSNSCRVDRSIDHCHCTFESTERSTIKRDYSNLGTCLSSNLFIGGWTYRQWLLATATVFTLISLRTWALACSNAWLDCLWAVGTTRNGAATLIALKTSICGKTHY